MKCPNCGSDNVAVVQETNGFSLAGILAAFLFIGGLLILLVNLVAGLLTILIAFLIGIFGRGKSNYAACLSCGKKTRI